MKKQRNRNAPASAANSDELGFVSSSGDIFRDLGVELDAKDELKIGIAREICGLIVEKRMTQKQVAQILGTDQAKVSNITRGRLDGFTVDRLVNYLTVLGYDIDVHLSRRSDEHGTVKVHAPLAAFG